MDDGKGQDRRCPRGTYCKVIVRRGSFTSGHMVHVSTMDIVGHNIGECMSLVGWGVVGEMSEDQISKL